MEQEIIKKNRIGEIKYNSQGAEMKILDYIDSNNTIVEFQDEYKYTITTRYSQFKEGRVKNPYKPSVYGVGYLGKGKYRVSYKVSDKNYKITPQYQAWMNMLCRCYNVKYQQRQPTYIGCSVCEEWLNFQNFGEWFDDNYYTIDGERMDLDKDILYKHNKIYSPQTCIYVPHFINNLFIKKDANRGDLPIGVNFNKITNKFIATCDDAQGKAQNLGSFNAPLEAFLAYKQFKEKIIKEIADEYKDKIPKKLYDVLYSYEVEITD